MEAKAEEANAEAPQGEEAKAEEAQAEVSTAEEPKAEVATAEEAKADDDSQSTLVLGEVAAEEPKAEEAKAEAPQAECKDNSAYRTDEDEKWRPLFLHVNIRQEFAVNQRSELKGRRRYWTSEQLTKRQRNMWDMWTRERRPGHLHDVRDCK